MPAIRWSSGRSPSRTCRRRARSIKVVPYLEWVLNRPEADRGHTQYNRLFAEMEYVGGLHAVLAWDKHAKAMGILAVGPHAGGLPDLADRFHRPGPEPLEAAGARDAGLLGGRATPPPHPTLDPIGSLLIGLTVPARGSSRVRLLIGLAGDRSQAIDLIARHLQITIRPAKVPAPTRRGRGVAPDRTRRDPARDAPALLRVLRGRQDGSLVRTPFTPRPFDHTMSNALGHVVAVTNRGLHTTSSVNSQQNRLTPDWPDIVTREVPGEAFYLYDPDAQGVVLADLSPLNDPDAVARGRVRRRRHGHVPHDAGDRSRPS